MKTLAINHHSASAAIRNWYSCFSHEDASYWRIGHKTLVKSLRYSQWIYYA